MPARSITRCAGARNRRCSSCEDVPALESAGVVVRMPASWRMNRPARPQVKATVGGKAPSQLGMDALLDFRMEVTLDGESLSAAEIKRLLAQADGLALIRGKWVEVDRERLSRTLEQFEADRARAASRWPVVRRGDAHAGRSRHRRAMGPPVKPTIDWSETVAGPWLAETLRGLRHPGGLARVDPGRSLQGTLAALSAGRRAMALSARPAPARGLPGRRHGARQDHPGPVAAAGAEERGRRRRKPCLLVAPASLLANWAAEIARFAPSLNAIVAHPSAMPAEKLSDGRRRYLADVDLVITSYGFLARLPWLARQHHGDWSCSTRRRPSRIRPPSRPSRSSSCKAEARIALTGTPIENRLGDLWSIFDFINPGLLGSSKQFSSFVKRLADRPQNPYGPLRDLVRPYILRRLKTDKSIIADLPDKTEVKTFCPLSRKQAALYQQAVEDLARQLEDRRWHEA